MTFDNSKDTDQPDQSSFSTTITSGSANEKCNLALQLFGNMENSYQVMESDPICTLFCKPVSSFSSTFRVHCHIVVTSKFNKE